MFRHLIYCIIAAGVLCSCGTSRRAAYFRDQPVDSAVTIAPPQEIRLRPYDRISIVVSSRDPKLAALFNLPVVAAPAAGNDTISAQGLAKYTVNAKGCIDFPVMGALHVAGLTRDSIASMIKRRLADEQLLADGVVTVEFDNLCLSVLGKVNRPGRFKITRDCVTILDAVAMAGDVAKGANRRKVVVVRHEDGRQVSYRIDLTSAESIYSSPAYYLRQNDIVYVTGK